MKIEKMEKRNGTLKFLVEDSSPAMVNALRRISMKHVPVLAIEDVGIVENNSPVFDEMLAQRLGQVPLKFDPEKFDLKEECDCEEGCANCEARFGLDVEGPGKVYSGDIVCESGDIEPLYDGIPLAEMGEDQRIELEATAVLSTGKDHSKHQAAISSYQYYPIIDIDSEELTEEEKDKIMEICPRDVFKLDGDELVVDELEKCTLCGECAEEVDSEVLVVTGDEERFIFKMESISSLTPERIIEISSEILKDKAEKVIEKLG